MGSFDVLHISGLIFKGLLDTCFMCCHIRLRELMGISLITLSGRLTLNC
jgi:hypothetical protein